MRHSVVFKFAAILLAACALTVALGSGFGVFALAQERLYTADYDQWKEQFYEVVSQGLGSAMAESYAARSLSNCSLDELRYINWGNTPETIGGWWSVDASDWRYRIIDSEGQVLESNYTADFSDAKHYTTRLSVSYPTEVAQYAPWDQSVVFNSGTEEAGREIYLQYVQSPEYTVEVWLQQGSIHKFSSVQIEVYEKLYVLRYYFIAGIVGGLLLAAVLLVYLFCVAGKRASDGQTMPGGLNRLALDIYALIVGLVCLGAAMLTVEIVEQFLFYSSDLNVGWLALAVTVVLAAALCVVGFLFALSAQWKMGDLYAWKHSVIGWCCGKLWIGLRFVGRMLSKLYMLLPLVWQYLLIGAAMAIVPVFCGVCCIITHNIGRAFWMMLLFVAVLTDIGIVCYGAYAYGTVLKGAQKMADGELHTKIDPRYLIGAYKTCGENLNALADVAVVAAQKQIKSDRMKTELITNVSHDIKTPLTSIINYIDLLKKAETPEQTQQYLQVLDRQSQRLKKLTEDLVEMSKATTGNLSVDIGQVDAAEAVNQALGEFADKLKDQNLQVVFQQPEGQLPIYGDGKLIWRVLSNLLSNIVKYALPGTRVYVDMQRCNSSVEISLKNISREALNVSADELTERFVRGDASRNTEGSGLGLNIAKSLMELQKGQLQLFVDGDLFKVTLVFPAA